MSTEQYRVVEMSAEALHYAKAELPGSRPQMMLHNFLVQRVEEMRSKLETAKPDEVPALQVTIREARTLLGVLHEHDNDNVRRLYGS